MRRAPEDLAGQVRDRKDRGAELTARGRIELAIQEYLAALELAPGDVLARQRAAELYSRLGRAASSIEHYLCLVGKYAVEGRLLKAIATCHVILQLDPAHAATLSTLTDLYAERDTPRGLVRIPSAMAPALKTRPSEPPLHIDRATLARIPLFSDLVRPAFESMLRKFERVVVPAGEKIVREGDLGDAMFAIAHGVVRVERAEGDQVRVIAEMGEGDFFGEMSLLSNCPRFATVSAATECELLRLSRPDLDAIVLDHPKVGEVLQRFYRDRLVANVSRASPIFRELPPSGQMALADLFRIEVHEPNVMLLTEGEQGGTGLFFLLRGTCDVFHRDAGGAELPYAPIQEGSVFGEVSLLQGGPVTACVRTASRCVVLALHREWVDELLLAHPPARGAIYEIASRRLEKTQELLAKKLLDERLV